MIEQTEPGYRRLATSSPLFFEGSKRGDAGDVTVRFQEQMASFLAVKSKIITKLQAFDKVTPVNHDYLAIKKNIIDALENISHEEFQGNLNDINKTKLENSIATLQHGKDILECFSKMLEDDWSDGDSVALGQHFSKLADKMTNLPGSDDSVLNQICDDLVRLAMVCLLISGYMLQFIIVSHGALAVAAIYSAAAVIMMSLSLGITIHNRKTGWAACVDLFAQVLFAGFSKDMRIVYQSLNAGAKQQAPRDRIDDSSTVISDMSLDGNDFQSPEGGWWTPGALDASGDIASQSSAEPSLVATQKKLDNSTVVVGAGDWSESSRSQWDQGNQTLTGSGYVDLGQEPERKRVTFGPN